MTPEFNAWWDADIDTTDNPYEEGSPAFWAWEGWQAGMKAAQQPLTEEQIDALPWGPHEENPITFAEGLRDFARAIERAHGIGVE